MKIGKIYDQQEKEELNELKIEFTNELINEIMKHKVLDNVLYNTNKSQNNSVKAKLSIISKLLIDDEKKIDLPADAMVMKGHAVGRLYPKEYRRYSNDIDVLFFNSMAYFDFIYNQDICYYAERLKIYYGLEKLVTSDVSLIPKGKHSQVLDLHLMPLYVWGGTFLSLDLANRKVNANGISYTGVEDSYIILLCNIANEWKYLMRDINDAYILLTQNNIDYPYIMQEVKRNKLEDIHKVLINGICKIYPRFQLARELRDSTKNISTWLFEKFCFGECNFWGAVIMQLKYSMKHYLEKLSNTEAIRFSIRDTLCLAKYKRAFPYISKCPKKIDGHTVLVFAREKSNNYIGEVFDIQKNTIENSKRSLVKKIKYRNMLWENVPYKMNQDKKNQGGQL